MSRAHLMLALLHFFACRKCAESAYHTRILLLILQPPRFTDDPMWGWMVRTRDEGWLQGFITVTTFTTWNPWFHWDSIATTSGEEMLQVYTSRRCSKCIVPKCSTSDDRLLVQHLTWIYTNSDYCRVRFLHLVPWASHHRLNPLPPRHHDG
jgi:hypothetical protein